MDSGNVVIDSDMAYPILFIPKKCTTLETNCELTDNVYIEVNVSSPDTEGNDTSIYSGFCNIKVVESYEVNLNQVESPDSSTREPDIEQMPVILSEANQQFPPCWFALDRMTGICFHHTTNHKSGLIRHEVLMSITTATQEIKSSIRSMNPGG